MLTPVFQIDQTSEHIIIEIHAPYANVKDTEADYCDLQFFLLPNRSFTFKALKKNIGEFFPNLDLVNQLLKPSDIHAKRLVEETIENDDNDVLTDFLNEPHCSQTSNDDVIDDFMDEKCKLYGYGFACSRRGIIGKFSAEIDNLFDLKDPEGSLIDERFKDCLRHDQMKFDAEHYIADLFDKNPLLDECLQFEYPETAFDLSFKSRDHLKDFPRKLFPKYSSDLEKTIALSLIDILFAYLYDMRTTCGSIPLNPVCWTIAKLSPTLSYLVRWRTVKESMVGVVRRSLCFPLYRHWNLSMKILDDLKFLLDKGKVSLLQCLVDVHVILSTSGDYRYLLNDLFITDYCLWIQYVSDDILLWLQHELNDLILRKSDIMLDLEDVELEAKLLTLQIDEFSQLSNMQRVMRARPLITEYFESLRKTREFARGAKDDSEALILLIAFVLKVQLVHSYQVWMLLRCL
ncbi:Protein shq1-like protein [Dirofilaria immitis]|nr:Protein shq1-like protein [Dirofilaria immitis]